MQDYRIPREIAFKYQSRVDHVPRKFRGILNGRPEWTRTIDLFRVKVRLTHTSNNFHSPLGTTKSL